MIHPNEFRFLPNGGHACDEVHPKDGDVKAPSSNLRSVELKEFHSSDNPISTMTDLVGVVEKKKMLVTTAQADCKIPHDGRPRGRRAMPKGRLAVPWEPEVQAVTPGRSRAV